MQRRRHAAQTALALTMAATMGAVALQTAPAQSTYPDEAFSSLQYRLVGPSRGGRAQTVAGVPGDPMTYYMGSTGGGVWKTTDGGATWTNISDNYFKTGSVGAIAVAPSDPNVLYVGMGETCVRGNFSHGDGVYKSLDAGKTWTHLGLEDTRQIGCIRVHPQNPDIVYVAALGHVYGPNEERGVYRSTDGGKTWKRVLYVNDRTGAVDLAMDPHNPRVLFAAMWQVSRTPWSLESGGEGSGLYRSTDGGETWEELTKGLPKGIKGKIGVTVSPARRDRVWAIVEARDGGVFRSDDGGDSWRRTSADPNLRQRAWYYTHIYADPQEENTVYVLNVRFHKSTDGGRTFRETIRVPHGDNHDLWIAPEDNRRMIEANDGGACVSFDGGRSWSTESNQPTAQFYHVTTDTQFPYRVYGAQQDNSTVSISSQNRPGGFFRRGEDFYAVGGGESGYIAVRPDDPDIVFAGSYGGYMTRYDHKTGKRRTINVWPENPMGAGVEEMKYRFQWTFPIVLSPHDPNRLYVGSNVLFVSEDEGQSFRAVSPDLTTDDKSKQGPSGGPITKDNTGVEYYCTIFTVAESPLRKGVIWVGSDDGLIHVSRDDGATWRNVTPKGMGEWPLISLIEASPHRPGKAYAAVNRYKMDDFAPYIYRTEDYGRTWRRITRGIDDGAFVRAVREDPVREGLLFAGTETGVYVSFDDGEQWQPLQLNLPRTPVTDLVVHGDDLVVATQGRSFWILDDITPLRALSQELLDEPAKLLAPRITHRVSWDAVRVHYYLRDEPQGEVKLAFYDDEGRLIREFTSRKKDEKREESDSFAFFFGAGGGDTALEPNKGMNLFRWNMRYPDAEELPGAIMWGGSTRGPLAPPGSYTVKLTVDGQTFEQPFEIRKDPRVDTTQEQFEEQFALLIDIRDRLSQTHRAIKQLRSVREQVEQAAKRVEQAGDGESVRSLADEIRKKLDAIEEQLVQKRIKAPQDPLNYPIRLNNKIAALASVVEGDYPVTEQARAVFEDLSRRLDAQLTRLNRVLEEDVPRFNDLVAKQGPPAVLVEPAGDTGG